MSARSAPRRASHRVVAFTYGELGPGAAVAAATGLPAGRIRSLRAHPYAAADDLAVLAAVDERGPAATLAVIPGRMRVGGETRRIDWASSWSSRPDAGGAGAELLLRASRRGASFGGQLLSPDALRVYRAARAELVRLPRLVRVVRSRPYWERRMPAPIAAVAGAVTDLAAAGIAGAAGIGARGASGWAVDEVAAPDERLDAVEGSPRYCFPRDHRELLWAMTTPWDPAEGLRYRTFYLRRHGSAEVTGFAWVRVRTYRGARVASFFRTGAVTADIAGMRAIVDGVLDALRNDSIDLVDAVGSDRSLVSALRSRGFLPYGHIVAGCMFAREVKAELTGSGASIGAFRFNMAEGDILFL